MLRKVEHSGVMYYEWFINNEAGDLFTDWRDIPYYKAKLLSQQAHTRAIMKKLCVA